MKDKNSKYLHNSRVQFTELLHGFPLYRGVNYIPRKTQLTFVRQIARKISLARVKV